MSINISYMGTKRKIAHHVTDIISNCRPGPLLDLFSGMCAVGSAVGPQRQIWCNDIQRFSVLVAGAFFSSSELPHSSYDTANLSIDLYYNNKEVLEDRFKEEIKTEKHLFCMCTVNNIADFYDNLPHICTSKKLIAE